MVIYHTVSVDAATIIETVVFGLALVLAGNVTHFTWWAIAGFVVSSVAHLLGSGTRMRHIDLVVATTSTVVSVTVPLLSGVQCSLFQDALESNGKVVYIVGNWLLHFWPSLRMLYRVSLHNSESQRTHDAARLFSLYCATQKPAVVYECPTVIPHQIFPVAGICALFIVEYLIKRFIEASHPAS